MIMTTAKQWSAQISSRTLSPYARRIFRKSNIQATARGPVRGRLRMPSISGTTWPLQEIANAIHPRIVHNQKRGF